MPWAATGTDDVHPDVLTEKLAEKWTEVMSDGTESYLKWTALALLQTRLKRG